MKNKLGAWTGKKRKFEFELEGAAALAFEKALHEFRVDLGVNPRCPPNQFARWLLERAAEAYAEADNFSRSVFWKFDLRPRTFEESAAWEVCSELERDPSRFPSKKLLRAKHQCASKADIRHLVREMIAVIEENTEPDQFEKIQAELLRLEEGMT